MPQTQITKFQICYFGWIYKISEFKFTKNKIAYRTIRCCSYKNEWWNFIVFETNADLNNLNSGDWLKINGFLKVDLFSKKIITEIINLEKLNKTEIIKSVPEIENEIWEVIDDEQNWN